MVFSMNVFKNKKRWQNKKRKKRALNKKKRKKRFYIYGSWQPVYRRLEKLVLPSISDPSLSFLMM